jgi:hypothetical protein
VTLRPFEVHRPASVAEASNLLRTLGDDAIIYGGGTELLLLFKLGLAHYDHLVDVNPKLNAVVQVVADRALLEARAADAARVSGEGLPIGVQVVARPWREDIALALAKQIEAISGGWQAPAL